jgi:hypothetical protein
MIKRCGWCDDELDTTTVTVEHPEYDTVCAEHPELIAELDDGLFYGGPDAAYEIALDAMLGVG